MDDKVLVRCPCGKKYRVPVDRLHKKLRCSGCGEIFVVEPAEDEAPPPAHAAGPADAGAPADGAPEPAPRPPAGDEELPADEGVPAWEPHARPRTEAEAGLPPPVDPSLLMRGMTGRGFTATILVALVAHVGLIALTSFGFVGLCMEYGTLDPRAKIREQQEEQRAKEKEKKIQEALEKRRAELAKAAEAAKETQAKPHEEGEGTAGPDGAPAEKSPVEKRVEEKSDERPAEPTMNLDDRMDLE